MFRYQDTSLSAKERAEDLLSHLSLEEKMGQVNCYFIVTPGEYEGLSEFPYGVGEVSSLQMRNQKTLEESIKMQREVQQKIIGQSPHHIPAIFHMEGLCGAYLQGATSFPSGIGRGSTWDPALEEQVGRIVGEQERAAGITHTLAPVLDISRDSRMGRQGETYGEDAALAAAMGSAYVKGLQGGCTDGRRSEGVAKHFLGFHAGESGIHGAHCEISPKLLREVYAKPFQAAITESGLRGIMPCYCSLNGEPVSASKAIMTDLLRDEMGFEGLNVSDYCAVNNIRTVQHVCESSEEAGLRAMEAGMDVEMHLKQCFNDELMEWFRSGRADTLGYNFIFIILGTVFAVMVAIILNEIKAEVPKKVYQVFILIPYLISMVVVSYIAFAFLSTDSGFINNSILEGNKVNWYMQEKYWPYILVIVNLWKSFGYNSIIYYATVIGIDSSLYEAAVVDGATRWQRIWHITLPGLRPTIITMTLLAIGRVFYSDFGLFYQVPMNSGLLYDVTTTIDVYVYKGLILLNDIGRSAAAGFFQSVCGFFLVLTANLVVSKIDKDNALF